MLCDAFKLVRQESAKAKEWDRERADMDDSPEAIQPFNHSNMICIIFISKRQK